MREVVQQLDQQRQIIRRRGLSQIGMKDPNADLLFERDWEVFVVRRDEGSGSFKTETACCEDGLNQK